MWGLLLSAATLAVSMATTKSNTETNPSTLSSTSSSSLWFSSTFFSGICLGVGINLLLSTLMQQFRVLERFRLAWYSTWETKDEAPFRLPQTLSGIIEKDDVPRFVRVLFHSEYGSIRIVVGSAMAPTSSLQMALITIRPGSELPTARAKALEVYQVLAGIGSVSQQGVVESSCITTGQIWVVDPGSLRWIANRGSTDLILWRTVDSHLSYYASPNCACNCIHMEPNQRAMSAYAKLSQSVQQVQHIASKFVSQNSSKLSGTS